MTAHGPLFELLENRRLMTSVFGPLIPAPGSPGLGQIESLVAGDFDGDGAIDLAASTGRHIAFLKGHGDGTLAAPVVSTLASQVGLLVAGRFDDSGRTQIASIGNVALQRVDGLTGESLYRGYALRVLEYASGLNALAVVSRRVLAIQHEDYFIRYYADGSYDSHTPQSAHLIAGDTLGSYADEFIVGLNINLDRFARALGAAYLPQRSTILEFGLDPAGAITLRRVVLDRAAAGNAIAFADLNGDGRQDLLFRPAFTWRAEVSPAAHSGPLSFSPQRITISGSNEAAIGASMKFADVNGDGIADRIATRATIPPADNNRPQAYDINVQVSIAHGLGDGAFQPATNIPSTTLLSVANPYWPKTIEHGWFLPEEVRVRDLNGDGRTDILLVGQIADDGKGGSQRTLVEQLMLANSDGTYTPQSETLTQHDADGTSTLLADVNGDGRADLVVVRFPSYSSLFAPFGVYTRLNISI